MGVTLNKDGKPRKIGSGKTKGAGCFAKISLEELQDLLEENDEILVSRVWLRSIGLLARKKRRSKQAMPQPPQAPPAAKQTLLALPSSIKPPQVAGSSSHSKPKTHSEEEEYSPPPLFASIGEVKMY